MDGDKEMIGIGAANIGAGFFQGFPVSTSGSRTAVAEQSGAKSQLTGVVGAAVITIMLIALPALFADLPQATLGAIVIAAALSLADLPATRRLWRQRRTDFAISITAFLGVTLLGCFQGSWWRSSCPWATSSDGSGGPTKQRWAGCTICEDCTTPGCTLRPRCCRDRPFFDSTRR